MALNFDNLIVDTTAFLNNAQLQELGKNIVTTEDVVSEVRCKRQLRRLIVLPYDLQVKNVEADAVSFITEFAKKTGDFLYLSATDIKLLALTYQLEKQLVGVDHLRTEPILIKTLEPLTSNLPDNIPGFYTPTQQNGNNIIADDGDNENDAESNAEDEDEEENSDSNLQEVPELRFQHADEILQQFSRLSCQTFSSDVNEEKEEEEDEEDSDGAAWITPSNLKRYGQVTQSYNSNEIKSHAVACLTNDFSMQNVLKQIGLNVISLDGKLIKEIRTYVLRCYACFHITPQTTRLFCPKCGNKTLKRVSIKVDSEGKQHVEINFRRPLTARGKKFPLPRPKGGKHAVNPILCEDQRVPQQRLSKLALTKNNPMDPDYIAGVSPFVMRDVSSRSAVINASNRTDIKYWMRKNPNEVIKRRRKK
ncbi:hypothetical protein O3M35_004345 [Rhynocoris fuscipes]|uniref:RNA-binding protein NOB1 n=1 Tax=Rhynocoris fuscipes TaxID=488301 RepID=A0AAW1CH44_9HEMI